MMHKKKRLIVFQGHPSNFKAGDRMDATLLLLEILHSQIRKEINTPIMIKHINAIYTLRSDVRYGNVWSKTYY